MMNISHEYGTFATLGDPGVTALDPQGSQGGEGTVPPLVGAGGRLQDPGELGGAGDRGGWMDPSPGSLRSPARPCHLPPPGRRVISSCLAMLSSSKQLAVHIYPCPCPYITLLLVPASAALSGQLVGPGKRGKSCPPRCRVLGSMGRRPGQGAGSPGDFPLFISRLAKPFLSWPVCSLSSVPTSPFTDYLWACLPVPLQKAVCLFPRSTPGGGCYLPSPSGSKSSLRCNRGGQMPKLVAGLEKFMLVWPPSFMWLLGQYPCCFLSGGRTPEGQMLSFPGEGPRSTPLLKSHGHAFMAPTSCLRGLRTRAILCFPCVLT